MTLVNAIREAWSTRWRTARPLGRLVMLGVVLMFGCCALSFVSVMLTPGTAEPTAEVAERAEVVEPAEATATAEVPATATPETTDIPVQLPATATGGPGNQPRTVDEDQLVTATPTTTRKPATPRPTNTPRPTATNAPERVATVAPPPTAEPTQPPPTAVPPTPVPPTAAPPTEPPLPTATLPPAPGALVIIGVDKRAEVVTIRNDGGTEVNLGGWVLRSEKGSQDCGLGGVIGPGQALQIWAMAEDAGRGGYNCGFGSNIWNNDEPDAAVLINPEGAEVSRW